MHKIVVITHKHELYDSYLLFEILRELQRRGYATEVVKGVPQNAPDGDVGVLHVDTTFTPPEYLTYARSFPFCVNVGTPDISKRTISGARLRPGEDWMGPVIVKSNLNCGGLPEARLNRLAEASGYAPPFPNLCELQSYTVYDSLVDVPQSALEDETLFVEKFIPEEDPDGYVLRVWTFCGDNEQCSRCVSPERLVKGANVVRRALVSVPEELRARRAELGFDYGKFDFVIHDGKAVLLDANRTPSMPPRCAADRTKYFADGFEGLIRSWIPRRRYLGRFFAR
jgi:hypothetical protein